MLIMGFVGVSDSWRGHELYKNRVFMNETLAEIYNLSSPIVLDHHQLGPHFKTISNGEPANISHMDDIELHFRCDSLFTEVIESSFKRIPCVMTEKLVEVRQMAFDQLSVYFNNEKNKQSLDVPK